MLLSFSIFFYVLFIFVDFWPDEIRLAVSTGNEGNYTKNPHKARKNKLRMVSVYGIIPFPIEKKFK